MNIEKIKIYNVRTRVPNNKTISENRTNRLSHDATINFSSNDKVSFSSIDTLSQYQDSIYSKLSKVTNETDGKTKAHSLAKLYPNIFVDLTNRLRREQKYKLLLHTNKLGDSVAIYLAKFGNSYIDATRSLDKDQRLSLLKSCNELTKTPVAATLAWFNPEQYIEANRDFSTKEKFELLKFPGGNSYMVSRELSGKSPQIYAKLVCDFTSEQIYELLSENSCGDYHTLEYLIRGGSETYLSITSKLDLEQKTNLLTKKNDDGISVLANQIKESADKTPYVEILNDLPPEVKCKILQMKSGIKDLNILNLFLPENETNTDCFEALTSDLSDKQYLALCDSII